ncbi:Niemann-Pick type C-related protein 1 [Rhizoctonia solani AG-1 IB]|uniref:Niemann-Pick type C-related protein 1 n=1 Tax=Thanatephorus cucumeris (strain AG1-IB / isolate 7/3/14) TaxID=1108050 RepID=M5BJY2_THACB|nr:Niemann-Pick type C-related protein 1 [Rhizoctonia solani AG-1 IB]
MNTLQDTVRAQFEVNKKQKAARLRNNRRISEDDFEDIGYGGYPGRFADATLESMEHNRFRSGSDSTSEGTIESNVASRMRERDADAMAQYRQRDQGGLEARRDEDLRQARVLRRQRSVSSSSLGGPAESSVASGVSGGNLGSTGSQSQVSGSGSGGGSARQSGSNKPLPPPPGIHPFAAAASPTQFPTSLQSQFLPLSNFSGTFAPARNHPIAGEPMPPPPSPGRRLRAVASANALGTMALAQTTRPKRAGTNEGLGTSPGLAQSPSSRNGVQGKSAINSSRPPPTLPPTGPLPSPPTPPKGGSVGSVSMVRETPKRETSGGRETPKKDGKETPSRSGLGLRAGVLGVVKPMLSPTNYYITVALSDHRQSPSHDTRWPRKDNVLCGVNVEPIMLDQEGKDLLASVCGPKFAQGPVCCTTDQIATLKSNFQTPDQLVSSCPACKNNFHEFYCHFTCSPNQADFVTVTSTHEGAVKSVDFKVTEPYGTGFYDSCKDVKFGGLNDNAMTLIGGGAANYHDFLKKRIPAGIRLSTLLFATVPPRGSTTVVHVSTVPVSAQHSRMSLAKDPLARLAPGHALHLVLS